MNKYCINLNKLSKKDVMIVGGKGASLGEMISIGILVPNGFVVTSLVFDLFLTENNLENKIQDILENTNYNISNDVENASKEIKNLIEKKDISKNIKNKILNQFINLDSKYVAVRSSATVEDGINNAWAGQLESYLNTTEELLFENIKKCWASLFTPRAIYYRFQKKLNKTKISVAVIVQKMIESEKSGVAFSVHPITKNTNQIIVEAGFGLGEAIVSGAITPDSYLIEKTCKKIIDKKISLQSRALYKCEKGGNNWKELNFNIGSSQVVSEKEIIKLANIIMDIENHYGFPCDIEWAYEKGLFYITQSRPITTLI